jgi:hypothetical protein
MTRQDLVIVASGRRFNQFGVAGLGLVTDPALAEHEPLHALHRDFGLAL